MHGKDEALRLKTVYMEPTPIAEAHPEDLENAHRLVSRLRDGTKSIQTARADVLDLLRIQQGLVKPGNALSEMTSLSSDDFLNEIIKRLPAKKRGEAKLSLSGQRELRKLYEEEVTPMRERSASIRADERALSQMVNRAYGITIEDEKLLWDTAPPRMPGAR